MLGLKVGASEAEPFWTEFLRSLNRRGLRGVKLANFVAWLAPVQQSPGWTRASHTARSLLMDMVHSGPNGKLSASMKYLTKAGWTSAGTVSRAVKELISCGLLVETRMGMMPNRSAWYACTWMKLRHIEGLDINPATFKTGGYLIPDAPAPVVQRRRTASATAARQMNAISRKNGYILTPLDGQMGTTPSTVERSNGTPIAPLDGAIPAKMPAAIKPLDGAYLGIAICVSRPKPAQTRIGAMLRRVRPTTRPAGYDAARTRFANCMVGTPASEALCADA